MIRDYVERAGQPSELEGTWRWRGGCRQEGMPGSSFKRAMTPVPTRESLLSRLKDASQDESWREFFEIYWRLIFDTARKSGLSNAEAEDVVQETMLALTTRIKDFKYDPKRGSFKSWLMRLTRWKIVDQIRGREPGTELGAEEEGEVANEFQEEWDREWREHIAREALGRVRERIPPKTFQAFHTSAIQGKSPRQTARLLRMSLAAVYMAKFKVKRLLEKEVQVLDEGELES